MCWAVQEAIRFGRLEIGVDRELRFIKSSIQSIIWYVPVTRLEAGHATMNHTDVIVPW